MKPAKRPKPGHRAAAPAAANFAPLKPQPRLLRILLALLAIWIIALLLMYVTTVLPHRQQPVPATAPSLPR